MYFFRFADADSPLSQAQGAKVPLDWDVAHPANPVLVYDQPCVGKVAAAGKTRVIEQQHLV